MTFTSYSQNYEDVLLWRALKHVSPGFYIDVGANDPEFDSVTKAFYDRGWHGINLEPLQSYQERLATQRPRDLNLAMAAGASDGEITLFDVQGVRGWATSDPKVVREHRAKGHVLDPIQVPVRRLAGICEEFVNQDIHFLKIDVEGFEGEVLRGMDFGRWRPWIVVVEATLPGTMVSNHADWEAIFTGHDYRFVHFDGLNRFYVAGERTQLLDAFAAPPNVLDDFVPAGQAYAESQLATLQSEHAELNINAAAAVRHCTVLEARCEAASARLQLAQYMADQSAQIIHEAKQELSVAQAAAQAAHAQMAAMYQSASWRVTAPLRKFMAVYRTARTMLRARLANMPELNFKKILFSAVQWGLANRRLRNALHSLVTRWPGLALRLRRMVTRLSHQAGEPAAANVADGMSPELRQAAATLPLATRKILGDLEHLADHTNRKTGQ